jgi:hypothetical protein
MSSSDPDKAWNSFYLEYGAAMFAWQLIESELATLFSMLSRIPADMAKQHACGTSYPTKRLSVISGRRS